MAHTIFSQDSTVRLSCRSGDYLIWCRFNGLFSEKTNGYKIMDLWQLSDGDFITITNRQADLPSWFEIHPLEVSGSMAPWMSSKLDAGYEPNDIVEWPNVWKPLAGDRLAWVGKRRPELDVENGVVSIITFNHNALVIGEPLVEYDGFPVFGGFTENEQTDMNKQHCRNGFDAVLELGLPNSFSANGRWTIG